MFTHPYLFRGAIRQIPPKNVGLTPPTTGNATPLQVILRHTANMLLSLVFAADDAFLQPTAAAARHVSLRWRLWVCPARRQQNLTCEWRRADADECEPPP